MALQDSLSQLAVSSLAFVQTRLELIALDLEDSAWRVAILISISVLAALLSVLGLAFASLAFVFAYWHTDPVWALGMVAIAYAAGGIALFLLIYRRFRQTSFLMADSIEMIREDRQMLRDFQR